MRRVFAFALVLAALGVRFTASADAQTAASRYNAVKLRDDAVRKDLAATPATAPTSERTRVITEARAVIAAYQALVRAYRASGYGDNALFNGATLAEALHGQFSLTTDLDASLRLYKRLNAEYPTAPLAKEAAQAVTRLEPLAAALSGPALPLGAAPAATATPSPAAEAGAVGKGGALALSPSRRPQLTAIERTVLPELVRVTLALDREVIFAEETLTGPARVFFDFKNVDAAPALKDAVLRYPSDIVRQIRVGRHPNAIRVVLDLEGVSRHSVYTLYNPFRIVIDAEAATPPRLAAEASAAGKPVAVVAEPPVVPTVMPEPTPVAAAPVAPASVAPTSAADPAVGTRAATVSAAPLAPLAPLAPSGNTAGGFSIARQLGLGVAKVVIDPGHGGYDPGAEAKGLTEAELTLDLALRLEKLLLQEPGLEVVLTRRSDVYVALEERTAIANREAADLFLSIHANTSRATAARGVETYFLSFAASPDAEAVAARENSAHVGEMHRLPDIIKAIALNNKLDESRDLATMVQEALVTRLRRSNKSLVNRGVKKAPFVVLIGAEMPSVLAEVSFLTNRQEAQLLKTAPYKQRIAEALHAAVMRYRRSLKSVSAVAAQTDKR
jgi:N-acetylmuramoyl-L-alanine amidase